MGLPSSLFMAGKYLKPRRTFLAVVPLISVLGVMIGVAVMIVVLGVMTGFGDMWRQKLTEFKPHVVVSGPKLSEWDEPMIKRIEEIPGVAGVSPSIISLVVIDHYGTFAPYVRGIDPELEVKFSRMEEYMKEGSFELDYGECILGVDLSHQVGASIGDEILVVSPSGFTGDEIRTPEELRVVGIFEVGMHEIDTQWMLTDLETARELANMEEGVHSFNIHLEDPFRAQEVSAQVREIFPGRVRVTDWRTENQALDRALKTEKGMMFLVLLVVSVVAAFGIVNTLITMSYQKTPDIGLLNALGFSRKKILGIFTWIGVLLGVVGVSLGVAIGLFVLRFRNEILDLFGLDPFPKDMYAFDRLPASISVSDILLIAGVSLGMSILAAFLTALRAVYMNPVDALRNE